MQTEISNTFTDGTKKLDISYQTKHFKELCTEWAQYNPEMNSLNIVHTRKYVSTMVLRIFAVPLLNLFLKL